MIIAFKVERLGTFLSPPVWGDERLVTGLKKYLERDPRIERVDLLDKDMKPAGDVDVLICMHHHLTDRARKTVYWYQNDHDLDIAELAGRFDGLLLASQYHVEQAVKFSLSYPWNYEPVICCDPDNFPVVSRTNHFPVVYLGGNIKGDEITRRYILPAAPYGLHVWGSGWESSPVAGYAHGPLKGMMSTGQLYTNADIILSCHLQKQKDWNMPVARFVEGMMCNRLVISDRVGMDMFSDYIVYTTGHGDLADKVKYWLGHPEERKTKTTNLRQEAIEKFSMAIQAKRLVAFFEGLT